MSSLTSRHNNTIHNNPLPSSMPQVSSQSIIYYSEVQRKKKRDGCTGGDEASPQARFHPVPRKRNSLSLSLEPSQSCIRITVGFCFLQIYMDEIKALVQNKRHRLIVNVSDIHTHFRESESSSRFLLLPISSFPISSNSLLVVEL